MSYIKHFGEQSAQYLDFRPSYPEALYKYLSGLLETHDLAWDCGTGNGQAAVQLSNYFKNVVATDINQGQLEVAVKKNNITYHLCAAEHTPLQKNSVDLITIAQALHWFNLEEFYKEVKRVSKPQGVIAAWSYPVGTINKELDDLIIKLNTDILRDNWPKEKKYVDDNYQSIPFPFKKIKTPVFTIHKNLNFDQLIGLLNTWSAVKEYIKRNNKSPIDLIYKDLQLTWGKPEQQKEIRWPLNLLVARVNEPEI